jgi:hypothetical protein
VILNDAQHRVVSTTMRRFERVLGDIGQLLEPEPPVLLSERVYDIDSETEATLRSLMATAEQEIAVIQPLCGLQRAADSTRTLLQTTLSGVWSELEDTRPEKLVGYGAVDQETRAALGPPIDRLIMLVHSMQAALDKEQPRSSPELKER